MQDMAVLSAVTIPHGQRAHKNAEGDFVPSKYYKYYKRVNIDDSYSLPCCVKSKDIHRT